MKILRKRLLVMVLVVMPIRSVWALGDSPILYTFNGDSADDYFGTSVSGAGDVNADGYADVIIGASYDDNNGSNSGSARVLSGRDGSILYTFNGDGAEDGFGASVSGAGDVNADGYADVIVGAVGDDNTGADSGSARVFSGKNGVLLYTFNGLGAGDKFGSSVSTAGDVNADGYADVIVGAPNANYNLYQDIGMAQIMSGATGNVLYSFYGGTYSYDHFGYSVGDAGDINHDGYSDVMIGDYQNSGRVKVYSGINGVVLYNFSSGGTEDGFGSAIASAGDVNKDGYLDILVGAPGGAFTDPGSLTSVWVFSGLNGGLICKLNEIGFFGNKVSGAGDVNNDGYSDFIVSAPSQESGYLVRVISGADCTSIYTFYGDNQSDWFGSSVSDAGDVNNDGYADVIVGASYDDNNGVDSGSARIFSGKGFWTDTDGDGQNDAVDADDDGDAIVDIQDAYPSDTDNDALNNSIDTDDDNDSVLDINDAFPLNASEWLDTDGDTIGNNADTDDDNDGVLDVNDKFPLDATRWQIVRHSTDIDGDSDLLTRSASLGTWTRHTIQNAAITGSGAMNAYTSSSVQYVAQLDANGDGDADILTRNTSTGAWYLHQVQSGAVTSTAPIYLYASLDQQFIGAGDFNNDGTDDVMLRSASAGYYTVFLLANHAVSSTVYYNAWASASSVPQGIGDFNGDGTDDLLVRRTSDNLYFVFKTTSGAVAASYCACNIWNNPHWTFQFAGDTNKDGTDDIVIRGTGASADGFWWNFRMNNFSSTQTTNLNTFKDKTQVGFAASGDYNADGHTDMLIRVNSGPVYVVKIVNGLVSGSTMLLSNLPSDQAVLK